MAARYRVALHGFSDFERTALAFCFRHAATRLPSFEQVDAIDDCDFIVAEASPGADFGAVTRSGRLGDTLFVGDRPPPGAIERLARPIDAERILRALDRMVIQRVAGHPPQPLDPPPDIVLPLPPEGLHFPLLDTHDIVDTTPSAFHHDPVEPVFADRDPPMRARDPPHTPGAAAIGTPAPAPGAPMAPAPAPPARRARDAKRGAKEAARRRARAARIAQMRHDGAQPPPDVLLLQPGPCFDALDQLLAGFGFRVQLAHTLDEAMNLLERVEMVAAFIDLDTAEDDGVDGLELCRQIKHRLLPLAGEPPVVLLLSAHAHPSQQVQAQLAGAEAFLGRPVTRGDAARALEASDVALPADERRS